MGKPDLTWPPVSDVLRQYGGQPPVGRSGWGAMRCPFHEDRSASAAVNARENIFYCFACGISTTGLGLIMREEGCDIAQARRIARERFGESDGAVREVARDSHPLFGGAGDRSGGGGKVSSRGSQHPLFGP